MGQDGGAFNLSRLQDGFITLVGDCALEESKYPQGLCKLSQHRRWKRLDDG
jgi:hypothetical protein